ncbi:hypothetical protein BK025_07885 [Sodalis sp. TME1]|nr:hypothetical protein BK025_07885 [Sodalis sp. TME1]
MQKCESTPPLKIEAGKVFIEEAPIKNAAISAASDAGIAANREAILENAANAHAGKYDEMQLRKIARRRNESLDNIADSLTPRRGDGYRDFDMRQLGRVLGQMQALAELQALIEVNEHGLEAKEKILEELNHPPFKKFPVPEGWGAPCVDYVRQCLYRTQGYPSLNWPLNGGSVAGV